MLIDLITYFRWQNLKTSKKSFFSFFAEEADMVKKYESA